MSTATKVKAETAVDLVEELGRAERELANLEVEAEELVGKVRQAGYDGDAAAIVEHRKRAGELPLYIHAARIRVERLRIVQLEALVAQAEIDLPAMHDASERLKERADDANQALREAAGAVSMVVADIYSWRMQIGQHNKNLVGHQAQVAQSAGAQ